jgi:CubicO group peptidase (beta-lactamase class C family)
MNTPSVAPGAPIASLLAELDSLAAAAMADWKVPGAALAIVQDGKIALLRAWGQRDVEANLPVTPDTQFLICSITKSFTATAVALLHDEGRLDWAKPVRDYLPEFRLHDAVATDRVTILDLLCHQSGLPRHDWVHMAGDRSAAEMLPLMRYLEPSRDIRAAWQYNNLGYNVLGLLIERVGGQSYESFIRARLTDRLGMKVSFTLDELEASPEPAVPYMMHEDTRLRAMRLPIRTLAGGAINTSAKDLANWMLLHLGKGEFSGVRLLPANLIGALHSPRVYNSAPEFEEYGEGHYGLGFQTYSYRGERVVSHSGGWPGWGTLMTLLPGRGIGVAVFTNRSPSEVTRILTLDIIDRLCGREAVDWRGRFRKRREEMIAQTRLDNDARESVRRKGTRPARALADYAGDYAHPAYGVMSVKHDGRELTWTWRGMWATLIHRHYETFELPVVPDRLLADRMGITFLTDRDGDVISLSAPLEPMVKDIVFTRVAGGDCADPAFRERCAGAFKSGSITYRVTLDGKRNLELKPNDEPLYHLAPLQDRKFRIVELEGVRVEFQSEGDSVNTLVVYRPFSTSIATRVAE